MSTYRDPAQSKVPYKDPTPLPDHVPPVTELGVTSAPLKSAAFFIGGHCKEFNGVWYSSVKCVNLASPLETEDFMLCKAENRDPAHCLLEGRRVTRCAADLYVSLCPLLLLNVNMWKAYPSYGTTAWRSLTRIGIVWRRITRYVSTTLNYTWLS